MTYWLCLALDSDSPIECVLESLLVLFRLIWADPVVIWSILSTLNWPFSSHVSPQNEGSASPLYPYGYFLFISRQLSDLKIWNTSTWTCVVRLQLTGMSFSTILVYMESNTGTDWASFSSIYLLSSKTFQRVFTVQDAFNTVSDDMWPASLLL